MPAQVWPLAPAELNAMLYAAARREERQQRFLAAMTVTIVNCWTKRPVTVDQLLGRKPSQGGGKWMSEMTPQEQYAFRARIRESLRKQKAVQTSATSEQEG